MMVNDISTCIYIYTYQEKKITFFFWSSATSHSSRAFFDSQLDGSFRLLSSSTTSLKFSFCASFWSKKSKEIQIQN